MSDTPQDPTRVDLTSVFEPDAGGGASGAIPPEGPWPPSEPTPPDRRPWILVGLLALVVAILLLVLLLGGDDDNGDPTTTTSGPSSSTTESTTTTAPASTTTSPTSTAPTTVTVAPATCAAAGKNPAQPGPAADTVFEAWVRGDQPCAATLMTPAARAELFARDGTGATDTFQGCTEEELPDPHVDCAFTYEGGATHYLMRYSATDGWKVYDVTQVAD